MTFKEFLDSIKDRLGYVNTKDVVKGLRWKRNPKAKEVQQDCKDALKMNDVEYVHIGVWDDEYYDFDLNKEN